MGNRREFKKKKKGSPLSRHLLLVTCIDGVTHLSLSPRTLTAQPSFGLIAVLVDDRSVLQHVEQVHVLLFQCVGNGSQLAQCHASWPNTRIWFALVPDPIIFLEGTDSGHIAKARWCVHGIKDPDIHELERSCPTPEVASINMMMRIFSSTWCERNLGGCRETRAFDGNPCMPNIHQEVCQTC